MRVGQTTGPIGFDLHAAVDAYTPRVAYAHFLAGPPGGRALPLTPTKQSDLAGGVYGPGASWASTGAQAGRAAIKAANAAASGERYDDVLEYYQVGPTRG